MLLILVGGLSLSANAQPLSELVQIAIASNPELKALQQDYLAALQLEEQVRYLPDPELGLAWFVLPVETRLGAQQLRLGATQAFPWKGTIPARRVLAQRQAGVRNAAIARRQWQLIRQLEKAYYELYALRVDRSQLDTSLQLLQTWEQLALAKVATGQASQADVLEIQLRRREVVQVMEQLERAAIRPLAQINQVINRSPEAEVQTPLRLDLAWLPFGKDSTLALAKRPHPDMRWLEVQQELLEQQQVLNQLDRRPGFALGMDYILVTSRTDAAPLQNGRDIIGLRAGVKIPIYAGRFDAKDQELQLKSSVLEERKAATSASFQRILAEAWARYEQARSDYRFYQEQLDISQQTIRILQTQYSSSGTGFERILDLEYRVVTYRRKMIQAIRDSHLAAGEIRQFLN